jgi:hypothetical protein
LGWIALILGGSVLLVVSLLLGSQSPLLLRGKEAESITKIQKQSRYLNVLKTQLEISTILPKLKYLRDKLRRLLGF